MTEVWLQTDEREDVAGSIRQAIRMAGYTIEDPQAYKWQILALHSALQGACVCHLAGTAGALGAVSNRNAKAWIEYYEKSRDDPNAIAPDTYLMPFDDLLAEIRKSNSAGDRSNAQGIAISESELTSLQRFHKDLRNQFTHFEPMGGSIEVSGVNDIAVLIARIITEILDCGWAFRHMETWPIAQMRDDLQKLAAL